MSNFTDAFGHTVTDNGDGTWTRGGLTAGSPGVFDSMAPDGWVPPAAPPPTTIDVYSFLKRFPMNVLVAIQAANPIFATLLNAAAASNGGQIDVTSSVLLADMQQVVAAGLMNQAQMDQVLNLSEASP
jgi:hypothetical protein